MNAAVDLLNNWTNIYSKHIINFIRLVDGFFFCCCCSCPSIGEISNRIAYKLYSCEHSMRCKSSAFDSQAFRWLNTTIESLRIDEQFGKTMFKCANWNKINQIPTEKMVTNCSVWGFYLRLFSYSIFDRILFQCPNSRHFPHFPFILSDWIFSLNFFKRMS